MRTPLIILLFIPVYCLAQDKDLIINLSGDSIACTISKITKSSLYYKIDNGGTNILALNKVNTYYADGEKGNSKMITSDCSYTTNEVDKFTKSSIMATKPRILSKGFSYYLKKINASKYLMFTYSSFSIHSIDKGAQLMFLMNDESIITLTVDDGETADYTTSEYITVWSSTVYISLPDIRYNELLNKRVKTVRYYTSEGYVERETKEKHAILFQHELRCIQ